MDYELRMSFKRTAPGVTEAAVLGQHVIEALTSQGFTLDDLSIYPWHHGVVGGTLVSQPAPVPAAPEPEPAEQLKLSLPVDEAPAEPTAAVEPPASPEAKPATQAPTISDELLREKATAFCTTKPGGKAILRDMLKDYGADAVSKVAQDKRAQFLKALEDLQALSSVG